MPARLLDPGLRPTQHVFCLPYSSLRVDGSRVLVGFWSVLFHREGGGCGLRRGAVARRYPVPSGGEAASLSPVGAAAVYASVNLSSL